MHVELSNLSRRGRAEVHEHFYATLYDIVGADTFRICYDANAARGVLIFRPV